MNLLLLRRRGPWPSPRPIPSFSADTASVAALIAHTQTLAATADSLVATIDTEREAHTMRQQVLEAELAYHRVALRESELLRDDLRKRPTRGAAAVWAGVVGFVGFVVGVAR